jgi:hypothetical protein
MRKKKFRIGELRKTLKSRINSQRRYFKFDENYILVLPFLEHETTDLAVNSIRFYINDKAEYVDLMKIECIYNENGKVVLHLNDGESFILHYRRMDGAFAEVKIDKFSLDMISIDHVPSIYVVLYSQYLKKSNTFKVLSNFCDSLSVNHWDTKIIKSSGFRDNVEKTLNNSTYRNEIIEAYKSVFNDITLEITISENNNANLSVESLEYYKHKK